MGHGSILMTERYTHATDQGKSRLLRPPGVEDRWSSKWRQKKQSGNKMAKLEIRKLLNLQRVIGGPWRIRTSNQRIMSPVM